MIRPLSLYRALYIAFFAYAVLAIPAGTGFRLGAPQCIVAMPGAGMGSALGNVPHIALFGVFFVLTYGAAAGAGFRRFAVAATLTLIFGIVIELEQGATRTGNCELIDLVPDVIGAVVGAAAVWLASVARRRLS